MGNFFPQCTFSGSVVFDMASLHEQNSFTSRIKILHICVAVLTWNLSSAALIGIELPNARQEILDTDDWLQELLHLLEEPGLATTPKPTTTTRAPRPSKPRKGRRRKQGRHRSEAAHQNGAVRLAGDDMGRADRGRVEIFANGEWGTVCDDLWNIKNAEVVCRQLGYRHALRASKAAEFGEGSHLRIVLDDVQCQGTEATLLDCQHAGVGSSNCVHYEDAGVICGNSLDTGH